MVASCSAMPPLMFFWGFGFTCFFTIITPSTRRRFFSASTRRTRPRLPLSLPAITSTWSLRLILIPAIALSFPRRSTAAGSEPALRPPSSGGCWCHTLDSGRKARMTRIPQLDDFGCQRDNLQKLLVAQLASHRAKHTRPNRLVRIIDYDRGVLVKADVRAIATARFLAQTDDHSLHNLALLNRAIRRSFLHRSGDHIAKASLLAQPAAER